MRSLRDFFFGKLRSRLSPFLRELGKSSATRGSGPAVVEAAMKLSSGRLQMELAGSYGACYCKVRPTVEARKRGSGSQ